MSKIALSSNSSGTGTFTIASPNSNTNRTLTLPDATGTVLSNTDIASQAEAEAGTDNTKLMTPLSVSQAIDAQNIYLSPLVTLSGANVDFTDIPATARRVTVMLSGLSSNSTVVPLLQLGDAGGIEATGYVGSSTVVAANDNTSAAQHTTGAGLSSTYATTIIVSGSISINLMDATTNMWVITGVLGRNDTAATHNIGYTKSLSATLTQVRLAAGAASSFDAGSATVSWE